MDEESATKVVASSNVQTIIHPDYPTLNKVNFIDRSVDNILNCVIYPENTDLNDLTNLQFNIHGAQGHYVDLSSLQLELKIEMLDGHGVRTDIQAATQAYFINNLLQTLIPIRKVFINNVPIETNYHASHLSYMKQLIGTCNETVVNRGYAQGAFEIKTDTLKEAMNNAHMARMAERISFSKQGIIHLKGPLDLEITSIDKWLVDGCDTRIILEFAKNEYVINAITPPPTNYQYRITYARLYVNRVKPASGPFLATTKSLLTNNMEYIFKRNVVHTELWAEGRTTIDINRPFQNKIPEVFKKIVVDQIGDQGNYGYNPLYYKSCDLINYKIMINGVVLLDSQVNVESGMINAYIDSLNADGNESHFIPQTVYTKGGMILVVKTNPSSSEEMNVERRGNLSMQLKIDPNEPLQRSCMIYVTGETDAVFEINADRDITSHFSY